VAVRGHPVAAHPVASGTRGQARRWGAKLRSARIRFRVVENVWEGDSEPSGRVELWVAAGDSDRARETLRQARRTDELLLW